MPRDFIDRKLIKPIPGEDLVIDYKNSILNFYKEELISLKENTNLLTQAEKDGDELTMEVALLRIRAHEMSLSGFFDAIADDATLLIKLDGWPDIPEAYQTPKRYDY